MSRQKTLQYQRSDEQTSIIHSIEHIYIVHLGENLQMDLTYSNRSNQH